jgi:DNA-binding GntR family transcriptional regulator
VFTHDYQHQELANLALARDADAACALMTEHIMEASRNAAKLVE